MSAASAVPPNTAYSPTARSGDDQDASVELREPSSGQADSSSKDMPPEGVATNKPLNVMWRYVLAAAIGVAVVIAIIVVIVVLSVGSDREPTVSPLQRPTPSTSIPTSASPNASATPTPTTTPGSSSPTASFQSREGYSPLWTQACPRSSMTLPSESEMKTLLRNQTELFLGYGTRVAGSNSTGFRKAHNMLRSMASCDGYWTVTTDDFEDDVYRNGAFMFRKSFSNIIATFDRGNIAFGHLILAAHLDSKWFTNFHFVGACDSAVPMMMILELMKRLSTLAAVNAEAAGRLPLVTVMLFDGEEAFFSWGGTDNTYGSRHLASRWEAEGKIRGITLFALLDLIAPANPTFHNYFNAATGAQYQSLRNKVIAFTGQSSPAMFPEEPNGYFTTIEDDHIPFLNRGVPILHLIDHPFPSTWHNAGDDAASVHYDTVYTLLESLWLFVEQYRTL